jgi:hypothetical protein
MPTPVSVPRKADAIEKRLKALEVRRTGASYDEVARQSGYNSRGAAYVAVQAALEQSRQEMFKSAELYRAESLERLNALLKACWDRAMEGSERHIDQARKIISDIGDLTGAKAPVRVQVEEGDIDRLLARLDDELNRRAAAIPGEVVDGPDLAPAETGR